jgi:hypothetical protein
MTVSINGTTGVTFPDSTLFGTAPTSGFSNLAVYTSSGTWTVPSGVTKCKVTVVGAGGGGWYSSGGGGGTAIKLVSGLTPGSGIVVTVGAAAVHYTAGPYGYYFYGGDGGSSSFGGYCTGSGGTGGFYNAYNELGPYSGAGGSATGGNINIRGGSPIDGAPMAGIAAFGGAIYGAGEHGSQGTTGGIVVIEY